MRRALRFGGSTPANRSLVICRGFTPQAAPPPFGPRRPPATRTKRARLSRLAPEATAAARAPRPCLRPNLALPAALGTANAARRFETVPAGTAASLRAGRNVPYPSTLSVAGSRPAPKLSMGKLRPRRWSTAANSPQCLVWRCVASGFQWARVVISGQASKGHLVAGVRRCREERSSISFHSAHSAQASPGTGTMPSTPDQCSSFVSAALRSSSSAVLRARWQGRRVPASTCTCGDRAAPMLVPWR
jgi:hypothetical protein